MRRILVTGANGFIGSYLMIVLKQRAYYPVGSIRRDDEKSDSPVADEFVCVGEVGPTTDWGEALSDIDTVVHLAARVHVMREATENPLNAFRYVNVEGTTRLAEQAVEGGIRRFIYISSIKVNGEQTIDYPFTADDAPLPVDPYGISKFEAEQRLLELGRKTDMDIVIVRPPLVYGPGVGGNFRRLMLLIDRGFPLPLASIHNIRSMVSLENLSDFLIECLESPKAVGETFLVSDGIDWSTPGLIQAIAQAMNVSPHLFSFPLPLLDMMGRILGQQNAVNRLCESLAVDITKSRECLNWTPPQSPDEAIQLTVDWYLRNAHA